MEKQLLECARLDLLECDSLGEAIAQQLRIAIRHGVLAPGTHFVARDVTEQLGTSRMPSRASCPGGMPCMRHACVTSSM